MAWSSLEPTIEDAVHLAVEIEIDIWRDTTKSCVKIGSRSDIGDMVVKVEVGAAVTSPGPHKVQDFGHGPPAR